MQQLKDGMSSYLTKIEELEERLMEKEEEIDHLKEKIEVSEG